MRRIRSVLQEKRFLTMHGLRIVVGVGGGRLGEEDIVGMPFLLVECVFLGLLEM